MALKTPVVDRIPTYPGRVKLVPVSGQTDVYDLVRADQPVEEGTPINKALFDQKAYVLTEDVVVYVSPTGNDMTGDGTSAKPYATIQAAVDSLPKVLDGHIATISIAAGTYAGRVVMSGFQGGIVELGVAGRSVTVNGIQISGCSVVRVNISVTRSATYVGSLFIVRNGSHVQINNPITINGASAEISGIVVESGSTLIALPDATSALKTTINNCVYNAIYATGGSRVSMVDLAGSNNGVGIRSDGGSVVSYSTRTLTATTANITTNGGRIYTGAQTSIPNY